MPQATRDIKRRIKSVGNTKKVTKAMEMVSAAKMRKSVANVLSSRSYATLSWNLVKNLAKVTSPKFHPLLKNNPKSKKIGLILITSNRGLCGGFNNQIISQAAKFIKNQKNEVDIEADLVIMGKKGREVMFKSGHTIVAEFNKLDITTMVEEITPLAKMVISDFLAGKYHKILIAYTDFISALVQKPRVMQLLPFKNYGDDKYLGLVAMDQPEAKEAANIIQAKTVGREYLFEPSPDAVLERLLPRLLEMQIYQAILESDASEHSARMVAMRNATDAASDMISELTLVFNKARQGSITSELADIVGGRAAVE